MTTYIDTHTHLDHCEADAADLVAAAAEAGVGLLIQSGTDVPSSWLAIAYAGRFPGVYATVGFHPHDAAAVDEAEWAEMVSLAADPKVVGIGETGLDYYRDHSPREVQREVFVRHIGLARDAGLPLVIHTRDADDDSLALLAAHAAGLTVVLHCFSMPDRLAEVVRRGYYVSFAGNVTYKNAAGLAAAARDVPLDRLLVETDAPYLSPEPLRGRPNAPAHVVHTYAFLARERGLAAADLAAAVVANAGRAFPRLADARRTDGLGADARSDEGRTP